MPLPFLGSGPYLAVTFIIQRETESVMGSIWIALLVILVLAIANGFFAASEIAVVSARRNRLQQRAAAGDRKARIALQLAEEPSRFLATIQIGITLIGTLAGVYGGDVLADPLQLYLMPYIGETAAEEVALLLVVLLVSYISLIVGELVPKRLALQHAESIATFSAPFMQFVSRFTSPLVWVLSISAQGILRLFGTREDKEEEITEEDILSLVREGTESGALEVAEREIIERVFDFSDVSVRSIMVPRTEIVALAIETTIENAIRTIVTSGHGQIPVYEGTLDNVKGMLLGKDLLAVKLDADGPGSILPLLREPTIVLEHQHVSEVMEHFKHTGQHMALVVDEYGQVEGIITVADLLKALTGYVADMQGEQQDIVQRLDGSYLVDGMLPYVTAERRLGLPHRDTLARLPEFETMAGLILALLRHIPGTGEQVTWRGWRFEVVDLDGNRIDKILIARDDTRTSGDTGPDPQTRNEAALAMGAVSGIPRGAERKRSEG